MITGICKAYSDFVLEMTEDEITSHDITVGLSKRLESEDMTNLIDTYKTRGQYLPGGSTPNSLANIAYCGGKTAFIGKLCDDASGQASISDFEKRGISYVTPLSKETSKGSPVCFIPVTPDGERTITFNRGVANDLSIEDINANKEILTQTTLLFITDVLREGKKHHLLERILEIIPSGTKIISSLQGFKPTTPLEEATNIIQHADIIFGNEDEYAMFSKLLEKTDIKALAVKHLTKIFVMTKGANGVDLYHDGQILTKGTHPIEVVDDIGAGDAFAGGFIYAYSKSMGLNACLDKGIERAAHTLTYQGGRPPL